MGNIKMTTQKKKRILRHRCDKLLQEVVRSLNNKCLVCGKIISCGHHYFPKSTSSALRYDLENIIPLCVGCHFSHHNGNPEIHNAINEIKGKEWLENLRIKKKNLFIKESLEYYQNIEKSLLKILK